MGAFFILRDAISVLSFIAGTLESLNISNIAKGITNVFAMSRRNILYFWKVFACHNNCGALMVHGLTNLVDPGLFQGNQICLCLII